MHIWEVQPIDERIVGELSEALLLSPLEARLLHTRGIRTPEEGVRFLRPSLEHLHDPYLFNEMEKAAELLHGAITRKERILIHGDYDADGVCGTSLMLEVLSKLGADVDFFVPDRKRDGYGLAMRAMDHSIEKGLKLVVSVDCGSSDHEVVAALAERGVKVLITDHHQPADRVREAHAYINPKLPGERYPFKELTGAGVAFKVLQGLERRMGIGLSLEDHLDLVAIGTLGDSGAMQDENRIYVLNGLRLLEEWRRPGLRALRDEAGLSRKQMSARQISFTIIPRLNSPGRMGSAREVVELLVTQDEERAAHIAREVEMKNQHRRASGDRVTDEALRLAYEVLQRSERSAFVFSSPGWHEGVVGIGAARLAERYGIPSVLIAVREGVGKGSARSAGIVNVKEALDRCAELLIVHGGHREAGGFSIREEHIPDFQKMFEDVVEELAACGTAPCVFRADTEVSLGDCTLDLLSFIERIGPFGMGNPEPVLMLRRLEVLPGTRIVGDGHLRIEARDQRGDARGLIGFSLGADWRPENTIGVVIDVLLNLRKNTYMGKVEPQLQVSAIRFSDEEGRA